VRGSRGRGGQEAAACGAAAVGGGRRASWLAGGAAGVALRHRHLDRMDTEERKLRLHEIRVEILLQVGTDLAQTIKFSSRSIYPMLEDTRALRVVMERETRMLDVDRLLFDDSGETELERCRGSWRPAVSALTRGLGARPGLEEAASLFERHVLPMQRVAKTRRRGGDIGQLGGPSAHGHCRKGHWLRFCL